MDSIADVLVPNNGKITKDPETGVYEMTIADVGIDPLQCTLMNDHTIEIDTRDYNNIVLDVPMLERMITAIRRVNNLYEKEDILEE